MGSLKGWIAHEPTGKEPHKCHVRIGKPNRAILGNGQEDVTIFIFLETSVGKSIAGELTFSISAENERPTRAFFP